jgi:hypothetical protein
MQTTVCSPRHLLSAFTNTKLSDNVEFIHALESVTLTCLGFQCVWMDARDSRDHS